MHLWHPPWLRPWCIYRECNQLPSQYLMILFQIFRNILQMNLTYFEIIQYKHPPLQTELLNRIFSCHQYWQKWQENISFRRGFFIIPFTTIDDIIFKSVNMFAVMKRTSSLKPIIPQSPIVWWGKFDFMVFSMGGEENLHSLLLTLEGLKNHRCFCVCREILISISILAIAPRGTHYKPAWVIKQQNWIRWNIDRINSKLMKGFPRKSREISKQAARL